jgi:hypothetical protein
MTSLETVESVIWYQVRHLASADPLTRSTAMDAVKVAIRSYAEDAAGGIIRRRRSALRADLETSLIPSPGRPSP